MNPETESQKNPQALREEAILQYWKENDAFQKTVERDATNGEYVFYEGPPTANGRPGIHHVEARSFKDLIPRYKTMQGYKVRRKAGWDTHGLPVELQVEKQLGLKSKKEIESYGVEAFNKKCKESVWEYKDEWERLTERMGYWVDMNDPYITYDAGYMEAVWSIIKKADDKKLLYKDFKVLPWCPRCGTALSSHELNQPGAYKDVKDLSVYVKFKIKNQENMYFVAWTTTPWTLPGNVALAVGADIDYVEAKVGEQIFVLAKSRLELITEPYEILVEHKGSEMVGMQYETLYSFQESIAPEDKKSQFEKAFHVYAADFVTTESGTGIVHIAPMYGADDFDVATREGLPKVHTVNEEAKFVPGTGFLSGRYVKEADENGKPTLAVNIVNDLKARGLFFSQENYKHSYPHCWRCDTPLLYYARTSWYLAMSKLRDQLVTANETINWEPEHVREGRFGEWLSGIKDWAISRDRYWGTPMPIWETADGIEKVVIGSVDDIKKYSKAKNTYIVVRHGQAQSNVANIWDCLMDPENHLTELGKSQASEAGQSLKDSGIDMVIASPFVRTRETAAHIMDAIGFDASQIIVDERIKEWNVGSEFNGKPLMSFLELRNNQKDRYSFSVGEGEAFRDVIRRCGEFLYDIESKYEGKTILIVAHNSSARALDLVANGFTYSDLLSQEAKEFPFKNAEFRKLNFIPLPHNDDYELDLHKPFIDQVQLELNGVPLKRAPEVMDVWFDSGSMPFAQDHKLGTPTDLSPKHADYISEGLDQTRGWFYTLHAIANILSDEPAVAYKNVICLGLILDAQGQKMSKSRGNVANPWEMFDKYGADTIRLWMYSVNQPGDSKNFDEKTIAELQNKFFRVIESCVQMLEMYGGSEKPDNSSLDIMDKWLWSYLAETNRVMTAALEKYDAFTASRALREFVTDLSQWYIRRSRDKIKNNIASRNILSGMLQQVALLSAPFTPFTAEWLWEKIYKEEMPSVHLSSWPMPNDFSDVSQDEQKKILSDMETVRKLVTQALEARAKANIKVRQPLRSVTLPGVELSDEYTQILKDELNVWNVVYDESATEVILDAAIDDELRAAGNVREVIRAIQDMRKAAGLSPSDRITLHIDGDGAGKELVISAKEEIMKTVSADQITETVFEGGTEVPLDGSTIRIKIA
jgi:isoleucyl-tRNA synthetase